MVRPQPLVTLDEGAGYAAIFGTLGVLTVLTGVFLLLKDKTKIEFNAGTYLAARNSQGLISMTLSYFVSGMGAWVIFAAPEAAIYGGFIALAGYGLSTVFPLLLFGIIAPSMRKNVPKGFTLVEYVLARSGKVNAVYAGVLSLFYMGLYLTAELASAGLLAVSLSKIPTLESTFWTGDNVFAAQPLAPALGVALITLVYTSIGGLPVSILTDRIQGLGVFVLTLIIVIATYGYAGGWDKDLFAEAAGHGVHPLYKPTDYGNSVAIAISLIMGVTCANLFHAGYWQRVWAAESNETVKHATYIASFFSLLIMLLMGVTGWIAYAHYGPNLWGPWLSVPWLIVDFMGDGWAILTIIFGTAMIASTCDSLQSGIAAVLWPVAEWAMPTGSHQMKLVLVVLLAALLNVPSIIIALSGQSILQLFLLADMVCATAIVPILLGFWERTHPIATLLGMLSGLATVLVVYAIAENWNEGFDHLVEVQGGIFRRSATYAFVFTPVISGLMTVLVSVVVFPNYKFEGYAVKDGEKEVQMSSTAAAEGAGQSSA